MVWAVSYLLKICCSAAVGVCSGFCSRSLVSTVRKSMYWLVYVALRNVKVGVFGKTSVDDEAVVWRPENCPKRDSAMISGQRSAAQ